MNKLAWHGFATTWRWPKDEWMGWGPNDTFVARKVEVSPWKPWFAWRPIKINNKRVWCKTVYRRCINTYVDQDNWTRYEYGNMFDVIKDAE